MRDRFVWSGRVLYLSQDPAVIDAQLAGKTMTRATAGPLRDNVSTDEITPVTVMLTYDERLGQYPYVGFKAGEREADRPQCDVKNGGFQVTVAGKRYGKGSSRESSPLAELSAGIRLIVAESFERIYQQNCDNIGILTTTDFSVLDRIDRGRGGADRRISQRPRRAHAADHSQRRAARVQQVRRLARAARARQQQREQPAEPKTLVEKIIERHLHPGIGARRARRRRVHRRRLALLPRLFHRHVRASDASRVRQARAAARAGSHHRVPGPSGARAAKHAARARRLAAGRRESDGRAHDVLARLSGALARRAPMACRAPKASVTR